MPPAGTLALSNFLNSASASSSRKRSHAEITRSQSRSATPDQVPSKRRRINYRPTPEPSRDSTPQHSEGRIRFQGDGFDYRTPAMSTQAPRETAAPAPHDFTIDLTAESDSDDISTASESSPHQLSRQASSQPSQRPTRQLLVSAWMTLAQSQQIAQQQREFARVREATARNRGESTRRQRQHEPHVQRRPEPAQRQQELAEPDRELSTRAPPFGPRAQDAPHEIINLSDTDESDFETDDFDIPVDTETLDTDSVASLSPSQSPEVEFVEERRVPQRQRQEAAVQTNVGNYPPRPRLERGPLGLSLDILRRGTQFMFGNVQHVAPGYGDGFLDRLDGVPPRGHDGRFGNDGVDDTIVINMDYRQPGFPLDFDVFDRSSETPQEVPEPYKGPPTAKEGFIRTFGEEDVILCPMCGDELAVGKGDVKKQVWVVKNCGHVYCGECAVNRSKSKASKKGKGKEPEKKLESIRSVPFTVCSVDGCNTKVVSKAAMFPIYL
ncbi:hypothetical protein Z517_01642 [Fonsecaea pedrosoi CBS 271.37]|uniref:Uncharacterized protein n=1 Tax=Fonsecaea pedrosoi CBS 271.37 TaxID=1442368 RepID=A0A0D2FHS3_9EURO|nr:uncharacterized protein Z517_01642 [Fonsecaea pedrosoi CBS 271.37]KIW86247.1 hypothetical protein Z517_01642 [Fonsecaea pedrosoi CBS 271.37]